MSLTNDLIASAREYVKSCGQDGPVLDEIVNHLMDDYALALAEMREQAMREFVRRVVRRGLKESENEEHGQMCLAGFDVPPTITVPIDEGKTIYVAFENATREQAYAHVLMKARNILNAEREKRQYDELLEHLDTEWLKHPDLRAGEVMRILRGEMGLDAA